MFELLEHEDGGTLTHHEAVAAAVEGPAGGAAVIVLVGLIALTLPRITRL
jgi:hypothetical protein